MLKEQHEIAIGNALLRSLVVDALFLSHGDDGKEPDLIYQISDKRIGIEVATAYYDDDQARIEWQLARGIIKPGPSKMTNIGFWAAPERLITARVQAEINDKCSKTYSGVDSTWLCIEQHAPAADVAETQQRAACLVIPSNNLFERIYLGFYAHAGDGGGFRVFDLLSPRNLDRTPTIS